VVTAAVMAAATPARPISPIRARRVLLISLWEIDEVHVDRGTSALTATTVVGQITVDRRAVLRA